MESAFASRSQGYGLRRTLGINVVLCIPAGQVLHRLGLMAISTSVSFTHGPPHPGQFMARNSWTPGIPVNQKRRDVHHQRHAPTPGRSRRPGLASRRPRRFLRISGSVMPEFMKPTDLLFLGGGGVQAEVKSLGRFQNQGLW